MFVWWQYNGMGERPDLVWSRVASYAIVFLFFPFSPFFFHPEFFSLSESRRLLGARARARVL